MSDMAGVGTAEAEAEARLDETGPKAVKKRLVADERVTLRLIERAKSVVLRWL